MESIKTFDIETQLSKEKIKEFQLVSNMNFSVVGSKVSLLDLAPKDLIVLTKNAFLGFNFIKNFWAFNIEKSALFYENSFFHL